MLIPGFDNNGVLSPGVDGFKNLVNDLTNTKVDTVKVKKVMDRVPENKTTFDLKDNNIVDNNLVNPVQKLVTDFGLNVNKQVNANTSCKHAVENTVNNFNNPVNLSEIIQPLLKPVIDLFETGKPKTNSKHHKSSHKTSKSQWVYFDRYRILPKPSNDFLNGLKVPRFYYLTLRDWTIVQALQIPVAIGLGLLLVTPITFVLTVSALIFAITLPVIIPVAVIATVFIVSVIGIGFFVIPTLGVLGFLLTFPALLLWSLFWGFPLAGVIALVAATIGFWAPILINAPVLVAILLNPIAWIWGIPTDLFVIAGAAILIGLGVGILFAFLGYWFSFFWTYVIAFPLWVTVFVVAFATLGVFVSIFIASIITFAMIPLVAAIAIPVSIVATILTVVGVPFILTVINIGVIIALIVGFVRSLGKPRLLTKRSLDKARRSSRHRSRSHHSEHSNNKDSKPKKHHHKKHKSTSPLDGVNNTLRDLLGTNPKPKHKKHHTTATSGPRHKVSAVKQVVVDYSQVSGVNDPDVSNLVQLNQTNTATNLGNANMFGLVRVPVVLLSNVENLLSIPNTVTPTLLKQQDTSGGDNTVCTPSGLVGITCTQVSPTVNENINSAVEEQTQVVPQTTTTTTTNTDGTTTKTTTVDKNKPPKVVPKKVWPLPTTGLMSRIDYFVLQNRATGRHNNLVNTMDTLYGTKHHPGPLRPIAEATAGLVDNI